jgi:hypothetical protein
MTVIPRARESGGLRAYYGGILMTAIPPARELGRGSLLRRHLMTVIPGVEGPGGWRLGIRAEFSILDFRLPIFDWLPGCGF